VATTILPVSAEGLDGLVPALTELLREAVNGGASLGFLPPVALEEGREYWLSVRRELLAGTRLLLVARRDGRVAGAGQLTLPVWPNARHRAEVQKVFVDAGLRGRGIGRALMSAIHDTARIRGRSLLLLNTRHGGPAERFYKTLGYRPVGVIPGYTVGPAGESYDDLTLYYEL